MNKMQMKVRQLKAKLSKQKAHWCENWGQNEIMQVKDLFDYEHYAESAKIVKDFSDWVDAQ